MRPTPFIPFVILLGGLLALPALAHKPSDSYLSARVDGQTITGQWDIALRDLDFALGLDADDDGAITWGEVKTKHTEIAAYSLSRIRVASAGTTCPTKVTEHLVDEHTDGMYAVLRFAAKCARPIQQLDFEYRLFFDLDQQHKGLLRLDQGGITTSAVFTPERIRQVFLIGESGGWNQFTDYLRDGIRHIWAGFDHILFLLALLLPAVMLCRNRVWSPVSGFKPAFVEVLKVVTAFTVAHSITLSLATLGWIELPSRLVESVIAVSVVVAALNNIFPRVERARWAVAFGFGLVHGFGFAAVLSDLGLPQSTLLLALLGFNVGVEVGQLAIVIAFLPLAYRLRGTTVYRVAVLIGGSAAIAAVAGAWLIERVFNLKFMPI